MDPYSPSYGTKDGACGYYQLDKTKWPYWSVGALTPTNFFSKQGPAKACGECFEIWCQPGSPVGDCNPNPNQRRVTIMISDVCEPCNPGGDNQIDLQALTFLKIAPWYGGRINIKYRRVDCTPPSSIKLQLLNVNGDGLWLLMTVQEVAGTGSISHVEVKGYDGDSWVGLSNHWGAAWEIANAPNYPLDIRIVNDKGQEPPVTVFAGPTQAPNGCSDPEVSAFSLDVNAQTPQASNGGIPMCNAPPPPPANPPPMLPPAVLR
ncbi:hypothetical protein WJX75_009263 [Coccomyxa subellipsoidea]|uniref:Expansin-like EG45 domain-containing protein n=1 Tax=Coccomyxa subellipsoidea TaxID=248742 RepID=A0ABR2YZ78_9CHLO